MSITVRIDATGPWKKVYRDIGLFFPLKIDSQRELEETEVIALVKARLSSFEAIFVHNCLRRIDHKRCRQSGSASSKEAKDALDIAWKSYKVGTELFYDLSKEIGSKVVPLVDIRTVSKAAARAIIERPSVKEPCQAWLNGHEAEELVKNAVHDALSAYFIAENGV